jgi:outer membrane lipoprotein-sorting protein
MTLVVGLGATSAVAAPNELDDASKFLSSLTTMQAPFRQVNADGTVSTGTLFMKQPGRLRMEYDGDKAPLFVVGGGQVAIFDARGDWSQPERFPLRATPLSPILAKNVNLTKSDMITGQAGSQDRLTVFAQDADSPEYGKAQFEFVKDPWRLAVWTMENQVGETTRIYFGQMKIGYPLSDIKFNIQHEIRRGAGSR